VRLGRQAFAAAIALAACDRQPAGAATNAPATDAVPTHESADAFVAGEGTGSTHDQATAAAREALLTALLGDWRWATLTGLPVDGLQARAAENPAGDGNVHVRIELGRVDAVTLVSAFEASEPVIAGPAAWRDVLYAFLEAHIAAQACDQRRRLFAAHCETGDTAEVDDALAKLTAEVEVSPPFPDGVPIDPGGRLLRPVTVYVLWRGLPIADVPLIATNPADGSETRATSDARGIAVLAPVEAASFTTLEVRIDTAALLGPRHGAWPMRPVTLKARSVDAGRWAVLALQDDAELAATLQARMTNAGAPAPATIAPQDAREVVTAAGDARARKIAALADSVSGRIDVVLVVDADSRFAGRMGSSKSWAEASGRVHVHDAWTGRAIADVEDTATASGVGEERASRAARDALARALADRVLAVPALRFTTR
jgi:hypothetical protein